MCLHFYTHQSISYAPRYTKPLVEQFKGKSHLSHLSLDTSKRKNHLHLSLHYLFINLSSWIEVAPAPIIYPQKKPSNSPRLEPIAEEGAEEYDDDS